MIALLPLEYESLEFVPCPQCSHSTPVPIVTLIHTEEQVEMMMYERINQAPCPACSTKVCCNSLLRFERPELPIPIIEHIPLARIKEPGIMDYILQRDYRIPLTYTLDDFASTICVSIQLHYHLIDLQSITPFTLRAEGPVWPEIPVR